MRPPHHRYGRVALASAAILISLVSGFFAVLAMPGLPIARRLDAQSRWGARPFSDYRISVRVEASGTICTQELETAGERVDRIISNNCRLSWLSLMTVARLFEIGERLEQPAPCYATLQTCLCHRIRVGEVRYDPALGYPSGISYRREVRPNLAGIEFWRRLWETHKLPRCGPTTQNVRIMIMSLTPLSSQ